MSIAPDRAAAVDPILVVDDHDLVRSMYVRALSRHGFEVIEAADGLAALEMINSRAVGLVLIDNHMPNMSGLDFVRHVRADERTRTLPVILMTGSEEIADRIAGLEAGANDYIVKSTRLNEVIARVRAQLRYEHSWADAVSRRITERAKLVAALGAIMPAASVAETAGAIVEQIAAKPGYAFVGLAEAGDGALHPLAAWTAKSGLTLGGPPQTGKAMAESVERTRDGPWVSDVTAVELPTHAGPISVAEIGLLASAPLLIGDTMLGVLGIGAPVGDAITGGALLAATIDYAGVASAILSPALAAGGREADARRRLESVLEERAFHMVFQPIVELSDRAFVGYEALTRFTDGTRPDVRFADALAHGVGIAYERATIETALAEAANFDSLASLALNVSPDLVLDPAWLNELLSRANRTITIELTEHAPVDDYVALRAAVAQMPDGVHVAIDDAGAGFASLRHIAELRPAFVKIDISLVRGITADPIRQALVAGLVFFAQRTGSELIAEGIETEEDAAVVASLGVRYGQGYLFGRPAPASHWAVVPR